MVMQEEGDAMIMGTGEGEGEMTTVDMGGEVGEEAGMRIGGGLRTEEVVVGYRLVSGGGVKLHHHRLEVTATGGAGAVVDEGEAVEGGKPMFDGNGSIFRLRADARVD